jgi:hypothetical protein
LFFSCGIQQPQKKEKRHHCCDKVSICDLPSATMMTAMAALLDFFDDNFSVIIQLIGAPYQEDYLKPLTLLEISKDCF